MFLSPFSAATPYAFEPSPAAPVTPMQASAQCFSMPQRCPQLHQLLLQPEGPCHFDFRFCVLDMLPSATPFPKGCGILALLTQREAPTGDVCHLDHGMLIEQIPSEAMEMLCTFTAEYFHSIRIHFCIMQRCFRYFLASMQILLGDCFKEYCMLLHLRIPNLKYLVFVLLGEFALSKL